MRYVAIAAGFLALGLILGRLELESAEVTAQIVREVDERRAIGPYDLQRLLSIPIPYDAKVTQSGYERGRPVIKRTRFYVRSTK